MILTNAKPLRVSLIVCFTSSLFRFSLSLKNLKINGTKFPLSIKKKMAVTKSSTTKVIEKKTHVKNLPRKNYAHIYRENFQYLRFHKENKFAKLTRLSFEEQFHWMIKQPRFWAPNCPIFSQSLYQYQLFVPAKK